ncbi:hypothetical protein IG631_12835 [Alternaria alternata]|nr:hypothetical protein IG631_12835 [Alternaria alternata]
MNTVHERSVPAGSRSRFTRCSRSSRIVSLPGTDSIQCTLCNKIMTHHYGVPCLPNRARNLHQELVFTELDRMHYCLSANFLADPVKGVQQQDSHFVPHYARSSTASALAMVPGASVEFETDLTSHIFLREDSLNANVAWFGILDCLILPQCSMFDRMLEGKRSNLSHIPFTVSCGACDTQYCSPSRKVLCAC